MLVALAVVPAILLAGCGSSSPSLTAMTITPGPVRLAVGASAQLTVTGTYSDGTRSPVTSGLAFSTSAPEVATVSSSGVVTWVGGGSAVVTATSGGVSATATVIAASGPAVLESITLVGPGVPLRPGATAQLTVVGNYSDGSTLNLTSGSTFASASSSVATVSAAGLLTAVGNGTVPVTATHGASGLTSTVSVTVATAAPTLVSIEALPATMPLLVGESGQLTITGTYSDSTRVNLTDSCTFASSNLGAATVGASGLVTAVAEGNATVVATHTASGLVASATVAVTLTPPVLVSIAMTPATRTLAPGATQQMTVTGTYSNGTELDVTSACTFSSSVTAAATVSAAGLVTAVADGVTTITATHVAAGKVANAVVTVATPVLTGIAVTPSPANVAVGGTQQLTVTGTYDDGSTANLTGACTFASSAEGVATVSAAGLVTGVSIGGATVTATHTASSRTANVTVNVGASTSGAVFVGGFDTGVSFAGFGGAVNDVSVDATEQLNGRSSLKFVVTGTAGAYSGGALVASSPRNLSGFNALTFYAKASTANTLDVTGIGDDAVAPTGFKANALNFALDGTWRKFVIPIPVPSKLTASTGLFHIADGPKNYTIWLNDIQYETLGASELQPPTAAAVNWPNPTVGVGGTSQIDDAPNAVTYSLPALPNAGKLTGVGFRYFDLASSAPSVATVSATGLITGVSAGSASVTATLGALTVPGAAAVTVSSAPTEPATTAAAPTRPAGDVISLYTSSNTYTNHLVDTWATSWSDATFSEFAIGSALVKKYANLSFAGVEFLVSTVDASAMTHIHVDVWTPNATQFGIKLVNDVGGAGQAEATVSLNGTTTPAITTGTWLSLDIPLSSFAGLSMNKLGQLLWLDNVGGPERATFFIDNVYFWRSSTPTTPATAAPTPSHPAANVISMYNSSGAYTDSPGITWCAGWSVASCATYAIPGTTSVVKQYSSLNFVGLEFYANPIDASAMTHFHVDVWTPNGTKLGVKPVNFGTPNQEAEVKLFSPTISTGTWLSIDIPLTDFTALNPSMGFNNLQQLLFTDNFDPGGIELGTFFVDNVYFWR
ncbi:MAG TPA: Ig-like domain-containing protein [Anaeromyxobacteraceae bacterium]|nr:Ig-like domain-containing protein [Anaeromyxobacteraceae bacterium]